MYSVRSAKPNLGSVANPRPFSACNEDDLAERMMEYRKIEESQGAAQPPKDRTRSAKATLKKVRRELFDAIGDGARLHEIAEALGEPESVVAERIGRMRRAGLVCRVGSAESGIWSITSAGLEAQKAIAAAGPQTPHKDMQRQRRADIAAFCAEWKSTSEIAGMINRTTSAARSICQHMEKSGLLKGRIVRDGRRNVGEWKAL